MRSVSPVLQITPPSEDASSLLGRYEAPHDEDDQVDEYISRTQEMHMNSSVAPQGRHPQRYYLDHTENRTNPDPGEFQSLINAHMMKERDRIRKQKLQKLHTDEVKPDWDAQRQTPERHNRAVNAAVLPTDSEMIASARRKIGLKLWGTHKKPVRLNMVEETRDLEIHLRTFGEDHSLTLTSIRTMASILGNNGQWKMAEAMYKWALQGYEKTLGPDHKSTLDTIDTLDNIYKGQGRLDENKALYKRALQGKDQAMGSHNMITSVPALSPLDNVTTAPDDATVQNYTDRTLLDSARSYYLMPLLLAADEGHKEVVSMFLETGAVDVNLRDQWNRTPLLLAAGRGHKEVVRMLLKTGKVDVNLRDLRNQTPLLLAARNGHKEVVGMLLETGKVGVDSMDNDGQIPLSLDIYEEMAEVSLNTSMVEEHKDDFEGSNDTEEETTLSSRARLGTYALQEHAEPNAAQVMFKKKPTLPEIVEEWFPQWFDSFWEPRIPLGAERIRWTCACGKRLYDDYHGLQPGAAQVTRAKLVGSTTRSPNATSLTTGDRSLTGWVASYSQRAALIIFAAGKAIGRGTPASNGIPLHNPVVTSPQMQPNTAPKSSLFLLFCVQTGQEGHGRLLHQEDIPVSKLKNDRNLFEFLRDMYSAKRKWRSLLTLRAVSGIGNCNLQVDFSRLVTKLHKHYDACSRNDATSSCPCWPDPTNSRYHYIIDKPREPFDMEKNYILHCFQHPECLDPLQTSVICHVPMKKDTQLMRKVDKPNPGWGIYFEEGWHFKTIWVVTLVLLLISFVFSITWWFVMSDIQGAFGVGSYCITVAALFLGFLAQRSF
ncbi:hypothetical protein LZ31DRAFT_575023 [Colletotrichum somersetense]|nr:hypothetical protein LZ31DRAFT_575023 [Colletotrichum somersetense]